jgi:hypothetical protein
MKPDSPYNIKAKKLVQFAMWYTRYCQVRTGMNVDVWFWIDYSCVDQDDPHAGIAFLPAFIAACDVILTWQTPDFDRRCWTMVERMLGYSFCPAGLTPYCINDTFVYADKPDAGDGEIDISASLTTSVDSSSSRVWQVRWSADWQSFEKDMQNQLSTHWKSGYRTCSLMSDGQRYVADFESLRLSIEGVSDTWPIRYGREIARASSSTAIDVETELANPRRRPRKLIYPLDLDACTVSNYSDVQHVRLLTELSLAVPACEVFGDRQSVEWGLTEIVEQSLVQRQEVEIGDRRHWDSSSSAQWLKSGDAASADPLVQVITVKEAAQRSVLGGGLAEKSDKIIVVHADSDAFEDSLGRSTTGSLKSVLTGAPDTALLSLFPDMPARAELDSPPPPTAPAHSTVPEAWQWQIQVIGGKWTDYTADNNEVIELARQEGMEKCRLKIGKFVYEIDLVRNTQENLETKTKRHVRHVPKAPVIREVDDITGEVRGRPSDAVNPPVLPMGDLPVDSFLSDIPPSSAAALPGADGLTGVGMSGGALPPPVAPPPPLDPEHHQPASIRATSGSLRAAPGDDDVIDIDAAGEAEIEGGPVTPRSAIPVLDAKKAEGYIEQIEKSMKEGGVHMSDESTKHAALCLAEAATLPLQQALSMPSGPGDGLGGVEAAQWADALQNAVTNAERLRVEVQPAMNQAIEAFCRLRLEGAVQLVDRGAGGSRAQEEAEAVLKNALRTARYYDMEHLPAFKLAQYKQKHLYEKVVPERVRDAILRAKETHDTKLIVAAWSVQGRMWHRFFTRMGNKR